MTGQLLLRNANVITMDVPFRAEALLVEDGRICAVGRLDEVQAAARPDARRADLGGRTVLPAFLDPHSHALAYAVSLLQISLAGCATPEEVCARLREAVRRRPPRAGEWVQAAGYDHNRFPDRRHPARELLDAAVPDFPLVIQHQSGHAGVLNTRALKALGLGPETPDPEGGSYGRGADGRLTGYLEENAFLAALGRIPLPGPEALCAAAEEAQTVYASHGIATAQEGMMTAALADYYAALVERGALRLDVVGYAAPAQLPLFQSRLPRCCGQYSGRFRLGGVKLVLDGSPQARTAWLNEPYEGDTARGYPALTDEAVISALRAATCVGLQTLAHCNGDAACDQFIRCCAVVERELPALRQLRPVMIHAQLLRRDRMGEMARLGIIPSFFAAHIYHWGEDHIANLGRARAERISPLGSAARAGLPFTLHQDTPVLPPDMLETVWCAAVRRTRAGTNLAPEERVSVYEALRAVTAHAACQYGEEREKGTLSPGKRADLVVLDGDPLTMPAEELRALRILATLKEGEVLYRAQ